MVNEVNYVVDNKPLSLLHRGKGKNGINDVFSGDEEEVCSAKRRGE